MQEMQKQTEAERATLQAALEAKQKEMETKTSILQAALDATKADALRAAEAGRLSEERDLRNVKANVATFETALAAVRQEFQTTQNILQAQLKESQAAGIEAKHAHMEELQKQDREAETARALQRAQMDAAKDAAIKACNKDNFKIQVELIKSLKLLVEADKTKEALQAELDQKHKSITWDVAARQTKLIFSRRSKCRSNDCCVAWRLNLKDSMHKRLLVAHTTLLTAKVEEAAKHTAALRSVEQQMSRARRYVARIEEEAKKEVEAARAEVDVEEQVHREGLAQLGEHLQGQLEKLAEALQMTTDDAELTLAEVVLMRSHTTQRLEEIANINDATEEARSLRREMEESLRWALKFMEKKASDLTGHRAEAGELKSIGGRMMASVTVRGRTRKELGAWHEELESLERVTVQRNAVMLMRQILMRGVEGSLRKRCIAWHIKAKESTHSKLLYAAKLKEGQAWMEGAARPPEPAWAPPDWTPTPGASDQCQMIQKDDTFAAGDPKCFADGEKPLKLDDNWLSRLLS